jgi:hypothetical protein
LKAAAVLLNESITTVFPWSPPTTFITGLAVPETLVPRTENAGDGAAALEPVLVAEIAFSNSRFFLMFVITCAFAAGYFL